MKNLLILSFIALLLNGCGANSSIDTYNDTNIIEHVETETFNNIACDSVMHSIPNSNDNLEIIVLNSDDTITEILYCYSKKLRD